MDINIKKMSTKDKLMVMELLWDDLCHNSSTTTSPEWHADILKAREQAIKDGKDSFSDWEQVKKEIWDSVQ